MSDKLQCDCGQWFFDFGVDGVYCEDCIEKLRKLKEALSTESYMKADV